MTVGVISMMGGGGDVSNLFDGVNQSLSSSTGASNLSTALDVDNFSVSVWFKRDGTSTNGAITYFSNGNLEVSLKPSEKINFSVRTASGFGVLITTATYSDTDWHHIYAVFQKGEAAGDRMRLWVDGSEITAFDTDTNPASESRTISVSEADYTGTNGSANSRPYGGNIFQLAFWGGATLPTIGQVYSSGRISSGSLPTTGLTSLSCIGRGVTTDDYYSSWTNNNAVVTDPSVPL